MIFLFPIKKANIMFNNYVFHRDDLVPDFVDNVDEWLSEGQDYHFKRGEKVRNVHRPDVVMVISKETRVNKQLVGFECYWWED
jgi:hypothetical protein